MYWLTTSCNGSSWLESQAGANEGAGAAPSCCSRSRLPCPATPPALLLLPWLLLVWCWRWSVPLQFDMHEVAVSRMHTCNRAWAQQQPHVLPLRRTPLLLTPAAQSPGVSGVACMHNKGARWQHRRPQQRPQRHLQHAGAATAVKHVGSFNAVVHDMGPGLVACADWSYIPKPPRPFWKRSVLLCALSQGSYNSTKGGEKLQ